MSAVRLVALVAFATTANVASPSYATPVASAAVGHHSSPVASAGKKPFPPTQHLTWGGCPGPESEIVPDMECTTVAVPKDYADLEEGESEVAVRRTKATGEDLLGILLVSSGPSGTADAEQLAAVFDGLSPAIKENFDVITIDQRAVSDQPGNRCFEDAKDQWGALKRLINAPINQAQEDDYLKASRKLTWSCIERLAPEVLSMDSTLHAKDIDVVRQALGEDDISMMTSYGQGFTAQIYAELFPESLRALVVDGFEPALALQGTAENARHNIAKRTDTIRTHDEALRDLLDKCDDMGPELCALSNPEDDDAATDKLDVVMAELVKEPLKYSVTYRHLNADGSVDQEYTVESQFAVADAYRIAYDAIAYPGFSARVLATQLETLYRVVTSQDHVIVDVPPAASGNSQQQAETDKLVQILKNPQSYEPSGPQTFIDPEVDYNPYADSYRVTACNNTAFAEGLPQGRSIAREAAKDSPVFGPALAWQHLYCHAWHQPKKNPEMQFNADTETPILFTTTTHSPVATVAKAKQAVARYPNAQLIVEDSWGLISYGNNTCMTKAMDDYLIDLTMPNVSTCSSERVMFENDGRQVLPIAAPAAAE